MPEGPSSDQVARVLLRHSSAFVHQRASPATFVNTSEPARVVVPMGRKNLKIGTFRAICRHAEISPSEF